MLQSCAHQPASGWLRGDPLPWKGSGKHAGLVGRRPRFPARKSRASPPDLPWDVSKFWPRLVLRARLPVAAKFSESNKHTVASVGPFRDERGSPAGPFSERLGSTPAQFTESAQPALPHARGGHTPHPGHARRAHGPHLFTCTSQAAAPFHTRAGPHTRARAHKGRDFRAKLACGSRPVLHRLSPSRPPPPPPGAPLAAEIEGGGPRGAQSRRAAPRSRSAVARGTAGARGPGPERGPQPWCERLCPEP